MLFHVDSPCAEVLHQHSGLRDGGDHNAADCEAGDDAAVLGAGPCREDEDSKLAIHAARKQGKGQVRTLA